MQIMQETGNPSDRNNNPWPMAMHQTALPQRVAAFRNVPCNLSPNAKA
jgi:hypothetical protein